MSTPTSQFPCFSDGDVQIDSPAGTMTWVLHSTVLRTSSNEFRRLLKETVPRNLSKKRREKGQTIAWKFRMAATSNNRFVTFIPMDLNKRQAVILPAIGQEEPPFHRTHDMFFKTIYNLDPQVTRSQDGSTDIYDCLTILTCGHKLGATASVRARVEAEFLRLDAILWNEVRERPDAWAEIGIRLRSPIIVREAMVHLAGNWFLPGGMGSKDMSDVTYGTVIKELARKKAQAIEAKKLEVENALLDFVPPSMLYAGESTNRHVYAGDIYKWQSLTIIRQFIAAQLRTGHGHDASDGGVAFYRAIGAAGNAYLNSHNLHHFYAHFPMSAKGKRKLVMVLNDIKKEYMTVVLPLIKNNSHCSNTIQPPISYLTCADFHDNEMPWIANPEAFAEDEMN
ncbi:hypothetical protein PVAG01_06535 [Phlyctema vagabunda]|uniref:BTB domain-containing protein n=1 Tax=Phlyctema vagabunda TaxID=108571 RepID=A0ABR4PGF0_9HELO